MVKNFGIARVLQGYIDEISVSVPWTNIMSESTVIRVRGLELTLLPLQSMDTFNAQELGGVFVGYKRRWFLSNIDVLNHF